VSTSTTSPKPVTRHRRNRKDLWVAERGQTTAEYALVLLAAGTIAMLIIAWARGDNGISGLFDAVITKITSLVE